MNSKTVLLRTVSVILILFLSIFCCSCVDNKPISEKELIRLHIRADSNDTAAQSVKLKVRDDIVQYLAQKNKDVLSFEEAYLILQDELDALQAMANSRLAIEGQSYGATVRLTVEYFPTRKYGDVVLESGYYNALIIELGSGKGDNWWCVVYPPLCYLEATDDFRYKSKIMELIEKYF